MAQELRATLASLLGFTLQLQKKFSANEALASIERNAGQSTAQGLDLFLTGQLVRLHQGFISQDSAPGKGTRVTLDLPLHPTTA